MAAGTQGKGEQGNEGMQGRGEQGKLWQEGRGDLSGVRMKTLPRRGWQGRLSGGWAIVTLHTRQTWLWVLTPHLTCCVVLAKLPHLPEPQFPCLLNKAYFQDWRHGGIEQELNKCPPGPTPAEREASTKVDLAQSLARMRSKASRGGKSRE